MYIHIKKIAIVMSLQSLKHLRIVVHINEKDAEDENSDFQNTNFKCRKRNINGEIVAPSSPPMSAMETANGNLEFDNMKADVLIIDDKSLQLNLISTEDYGPYTNISHKMHFDHVSHSTTDMIKCELALLMDDLLLKRKNCCIMRFAAKQEVDIPVFFDLLITFLNKTIYHQKYKLQYVKLECLDIAVQNSRNQKCFAMRASVANNSYEDCNNNEAIFRLGKNDKRQFRSTGGLLRWIVNEYRFKFSDNKGHEKLQFSFSIVDHQQNLFKVKLSLFNIFLNFMSTEDRNHWHHYMDHTGDGCQGINCNFIHSGLTISLSNYIEGISSEKTLLLFDVPTNIKMTADTIEILEMAHSTIKNRKKKILLLHNNVNLNPRLPRSSNEFTACLPSDQWKELKNNLATNSKKVHRSPLPLFMRMSLCDSKDLNTLSGWYRRIDDCFEKNRQFREAYFSRYFKLKTDQISSNIKNIFKSLESLEVDQSEKHLNELQEDEIELMELFESYRDIRMQFRQISEDTKGTNFEEILNIYLETKTFDLNNQAFALKRKYLELCQKHLNLTFDILSNGVLLELEI